MSYPRNESEKSAIKQYVNNAKFVNLGGRKKSPTIHALTYENLVFIVGRPAITRSVQRLTHGRMFQSSNARIDKIYIYGAAFIAGPSLSYVSIRSLLDIEFICPSGNR